MFNLTVTQNGSAFTLDGFDEQCGGNPRLPVHGIAVPQPNGTIIIGLNVVNNPGSLTPVNLEAVISPTTVSGTWRDSAGSSGAFAFNPPGTSGGPRPVATPSGIPGAIGLFADGGFVAGGAFGQGVIPAAGPGTRMMWYPKKAAFRAGHVDAQFPFGDDINIGLYSTALGRNTIAVGGASFAAGQDTGAFGTSSVAMGNSSVAHAPFSVAIGNNVQAGGQASVALGSFASTTSGAPGSFVYGDFTAGGPPLTINGPNVFTVRASGGYHFFSNTALSTGCHLAGGTSVLSCTSDRNTKELFEPLDGEMVLGQLRTMPIERWSFRDQPGVAHVGPVAQDFFTAFGLGTDDKTIGHSDVSGISLRAIQALEACTRELMQENAALKARLDRLETKQP